MATAKKTTRTTRSQRTTQVDEGPRYRLLKDSVLDNHLISAGAEVTYYGEPGSALYPINAEAKSRKIQVRDIRRNADLSDEEKLAELKVLSDEWNGVEAADAFAEGDDFDEGYEAAMGRTTKPLDNAARAELEKHAQATVDATRAAEQDNTNKVRVQLQGDPADPEGKLSKDGLQGNTPVLDGNKKK